MTSVVDDLVRAAVELGVTPHELKGSDDARVAVRVGAGLGDLPVRREQWRSVAARVLDAHEAAARRHGGSRCKACDAPICWGETETGKAMSVDPLPRLDGNVIRVPQGKRVVLRVVPRSALPVVGRPAYFAHFVTCPFADQFRRRGRSSDAGGGRPARCSVCRLRLDPALSAEGWSTHPSCDPDEKRKP